MVSIGCKQVLITYLINILYADDIAEYKPFLSQILINW